MKKILKKEVIIAFIIGVLIASGITVYAYSYYAKDIGYTKPGETQAISVEAALNDLYQKNKHIERGQENITYSHSWQGKTITFEKEYENPPKVFYKSNSSSDGGTVAVTDVSTTQFTLNWAMLPSNFLLPNDTIYWIAINE